MALVVDKDIGRLGRGPACLEVSVEQEGVESAGWCRRFTDGEEGVRGAVAALPEGEGLLVVGEGHFAVAGEAGEVVHPVILLGIRN